VEVEKEGVEWDGEKAVEVEEEVEKAEKVEEVDDSDLM
jgi:hypothetical protein